MLKRIAITTFSLFALFFCIAQNKGNDINFNKFEALHISLSHPRIKINPAFPISNINVIDVRFDTSCFGMMQHLAKENVMVVDCKKNISFEIKGFFSQIIPNQK